MGVGRVELREQVGDWRSPELHVDAERRVVANVALVGVTSRNGYRYAESALREAAGLYERKPVFLDHAPNVTRPQERSARDLVGHIVGARFEGGRVRGDVQVIDAEAGQTFLALAASDAPGVGMSHVVLAERGADRTVVEKIHEVVSIDAVVFPATTSSLRENHHEAAEPWAGSLEAWLAKFDEHVVERVRRELGEAVQVRRVAVFDGRAVVEVVEEGGLAQLSAVEWRREGAEVVFGELSVGLTAESAWGWSWSEASAAERALRAERDELRERLAEHERGLEVESLLAGARLPECMVTEELRRRLAAEPDARVRRGIVAEQQGIVRALAGTSPRSLERTGVAGGGPSDAVIVAAVRGGRAGRN